MRFHTLSAVLVAATALVSGAVADEPVATTTLTRTLQRVVQTVTATRPSSGIVTSVPTGAPVYPNGTSSYSSPAVSPPAQQTGAAVNLHIDAAGLAALAGIVGFLAL